MTSSDLHSFLDIGIDRRPTAPCSRALSPTRLPGLDHALNPYRGCSHGCVYCYAPSLLHLSPEDWARPLPKRNLIRLLEREAPRAKGMIGIGTSTDPYQPLESEHLLTRDCLRVLRDYGLRACVHTKSDLVVRDTDLLEGMEAGITVTFLDEAVWRFLEPGAPSPRRRLDAVTALVAAGVVTFVMIGPMLSVNEGREEALAAAVADTGVRRVTVDVLNRGTSLDASGGMKAATAASVSTLKEHLASMGLDVSDAF